MNFSPDQTLDGSGGHSHEVTIFEEELDFSPILQTAILASLSTSQNNQLRQRQSSRLDMFFPMEIWENICGYLYPSQLCRLSLTSRIMYEYVGSLKIWKKWFHKTHGPLAQFRPLTGLPESRSYMLYMCATSLLICEECGRRIRHDEISVLDKPYYLTLSINTQAVLPRKLHLCLNCRQKSGLHSLLPQSICDSYLPKSEVLGKYHGIIGRTTLKSITDRTQDPLSYNVLYSEKAVWQIIRRRLGGDVGFYATPEHVSNVRLCTFLRIQSLLVQC